MTADQRAVARILNLVEEGLESNAVHDGVATWRVLMEIRAVAEMLARRPAPDDTTLDLSDYTHGAEQ